MEQLENGAYIIKRKERIILAIWPEKMKPFVTWRLEGDEVVDGNYFGDIASALADFNKRTI